MATDTMPDTKQLDNASSCVQNEYTREHSRPATEPLPSSNPRSALSEIQRLNSRVDYRPGQRKQIVAQCERCQKWKFIGDLKAVAITERDGASSDQIVCPDCIRVLHRKQTLTAASRFNLSTKTVQFLSVVFSRTSASAAAAKSFREHLISLDDTLALWVKQDGKCALTGQPMKTTKGLASNLGIASLDRIDSRRGYDRSNIQWVCWGVNLMKQDIDQAEFQKWCRRVALFAQEQAKAAKSAA